MKRAKKEIITGEILDEYVHFSLQELCQACRVPADFISELVEYGLIKPTEKGKEWRFDAIALQRSTCAIRLQRTLEINIEGLALILDLLDEVQNLRTKVAVLEDQLAEFENEK